MPEKLDNASIEIYWVRTEPRSNQTIEDPIATLPLESGKYQAYGHPFDLAEIDLDLSGVRRGFRGSRVVIIGVEGLVRQLPVSISRRTGIGENTFSSTDRIRVQFTQPGVLRRVKAG